jgi:hypothetical protein
LPQYNLEDNDDLFQAAEEEFLKVMATTVIWGKWTHTSLTQHVAAFTTGREYEQHFSAPALQQHTAHATEISTRYSLKTEQAVGVTDNPYNASMPAAPTGSLQDRKGKGKRAREVETTFIETAALNRWTSFYHPGDRLDEPGIGDEERKPKRKAASFQLAEGVSKTTSLNRMAMKAVRIAKKSKHMKCPLRVCHPRAADVRFSNACAGDGQNGVHRLW